MGYDYKKHFGEILLTEDLTSLPEERTWRQQAPEKDAEPHQIVLYLGCNVLRTSHMIRTVTAIFDRLGLDYVAVGGPTYCCGIVHHRNGDTAASNGMNRRTVELFQRYKPEEVVMWCPSCMFFYDEIQKFEWPFPVRHTTEFLADRLRSIEFTHRVDQAVALHYHSQSEPRKREGAACRRLLEAVPGLRLVDVGSEPRFGRLCTADVQAQLGQDVWNALIRDEIERARTGSALTLATIYHGCQRLMCSFEAEGRITLEHCLSVFARALGIEFEDRYKTFRLWQDPERVLGESTPCQTANHVDPERARQLVEKTFGCIAAVPDGSTAAAS